MVSRPDLNFGLDLFPSGLPGVGVVDLLRLRSSAALRLVTEAFLLLSQDMVDIKSVVLRKPAFFGVDGGSVGSKQGKRLVRCRCKTWLN
jgi:hypothetical protein